MQATVRRAAPQDVARVLELCRLLSVGDEPELSEQAARQRLRATADDPDHAVYVAESDGRILGTFALVFVAGLAHAGRPFGIVEDVAVDPCAQGQGVGRRMMRFAMDRCAERGCYKLALSSRLSRGPAHRFYESLGFEKHGFSFMVA